VLVSEWEESRTMAFPSSTCGLPHQAPEGVAGFAQASNSPFHGMGPLDGDHQLEKLEFALAVALTRGDQARSEKLRFQIAAMGGNCVEPGT
jgi:hypothetical protein